MTTAVPATVRNGNHISIRGSNHRLPPNGRTIGAIRIMGILHLVSTSDEHILDTNGPLRMIASAIPIKAIATIMTIVAIRYSNDTEGENVRSCGGRAAYDADTDRFLILDVSRFKYPPVWVGPRNCLLRSMTVAIATWRGWRDATPSLLKINPPVFGHLIATIS